MHSRRSIKNEWKHLNYPFVYTIIPNLLFHKICLLFHKFKWPFHNYLSGTSSYFGTLLIYSFKQYILNTYSVLRTFLSAKYFSNSESVNPLGTNQFSTLITNMKACLLLLYKLTVQQQKETMWIAHIMHYSLLTKSYILWKNMGLRAKSKFFNVSYMLEI